jgi:hypothetical protein
LHRERRRVEERRRLRGHRLVRLGPLGADPLGQLAHRGPAECVVGRDVVVAHAHQAEQHRGEHTRAVLARRTVEYQRQPIRRGHRFERRDDRSRAQLEHLEISRREIVDRVELGAGEVALPHPLEQREMLVRGVDRLGWDATVIVELTDGAEIEHGADPERGNPREVGAFDAMNAVRAVEPPPPHGSAAASHVAAEVTEVEGTLEGDPPGAGLRFQFHVRTVTGQYDIELADV